MVNGERQLTKQEEAVLNYVTGVANEVGDMLNQIANFPDVDIRWLAVARTHLQEGFMFTKRAIAQPEGF